MPFYRGILPLLFLTLFFSLVNHQTIFCQQTVKITGIVTDETGKPLNAVSVLLKNKVNGNTVGTQTNEKGAYTISAAPDNVLIFSSVSYEVLEVNIGNKKVVNASLKLKSADLDDVVVIGYQAVKRKDATVAIGSVNVDDLKKAPVSSFDQALAGRQAGVQVSSNDGQPGSNVNIIIRGANSISQDNSPLYVIDGFPREGADAGRIDPNDIETMDVLKDGAATAIYGARGANGVIIITTKRGKNAVPTINVTSWVAQQSNIKRMRMLNNIDWAKLQIDNTLSTPPTDYNNYLIDGRPFKFYTDSTKTFDFQDVIFKKAFMHNYSISINGGNATTQYAISGNYLSQEGTIINSGFTRYSGRLVLDQKIGDKIKIGINATYSYNKTSGISPSLGINGSSSGSLMSSILGFRPFVFNSDSANNAFLEQPIDAGNTSSTNYTFNPLLNQRNLVRENKAGNLFVNGYLEYNLTKRLRLRITGGIDYTNAQNIIFNNENTVYGSPFSVIGANGPNGSVQHVVTSQWTNENVLTYSLAASKKHQLTFLGGLSLQGYKTSAFTVSNSGLAFPNLGIYGIAQSNAAGLVSVGENSTLWTLASYFGRVQYTFLSKYYISASVRNDGSSKFVSDKQWSFFPALSLKWKVTEEPFFKKYKGTINDLGIRFSAAKSGNNRINAFSYLSQIASSIGSVSNNSSLGAFGYTFNVGNPQANQFPGAIVTVMGNKDLKWETTTTYNLGLDASLLKGKISIVIDAYIKNTNDLLYNSPIPTSTGFQRAFKNIGSIQNKGLEFTVNTTNIKKKNVTWTTSFNISFNRGKVLSLTEGLDVVPVTVGWDNSYGSSPAYLLKVGKPLGSLFGLVWDGNYQFSDFILNSSGKYILRDNVPSNQSSRTATAGAAPQPGDIKFVDINKDGVINASDQTVLGNGFPLHTGGFTNNIRYKNFDLSIFFQWSYGQQVHNANRLRYEINGGPGNQFESVLNRWTPTNQNNEMFRAGTGGPQGPTFYSTRTLEDASYIRLKTAQLAYNLPQAIMKKWKMKQLRFYISGQNLITLSKYSGFDPEVSTYYSVLSPSFDWGAYPRARVYTFGINLTF